MRRTLATLAFGAAALFFVLTLAGYAGHWGPALEVITSFRLHLAVLPGTPPCRSLMIRQAWAGRCQ